MAERRIAVLDDYQKVAPLYADWSSLPADCVVELFDTPLGDETTTAEVLEPFEIICAMRERTPFPQSLLDRLPKLKLLITTGMRNASIDVQAAQDNMITVCGTGGQAHPTAELAWALILAATRNLVQEAGNMRQGRWQTTVGGDLNGKVLGVLGLGKLGSQVARVGTAFDMEVIAWSQNLTEEKALAAGARLVGREELFRGADVLSIHLVLSERSRGLVGAAELALMKPSALLVNTSRGPIVDEMALLAALKDNRIAGAAIDVYAEEPLPAEHPLRGLPNALLTPHIGYVSEATYRTFYEETLADIQAYLAGEPVRVLAP